MHICFDFANPWVGMGAPWGAHDLRWGAQGLLSALCSQWCLGTYGLSPRAIVRVAEALGSRTRQTSGKALGPESAWMWGVPKCCSDPVVLERPSGLQSVMLGGTSSGRNQTWVRCMLGDCPNHCSIFQTLLVDFLLESP